MESRFEEAIEHYTMAIRLAPESAVLYTNRALALWKLERFASSEADCSAALVLEPKSVKALYRRAQARRRLDKVSDAIDDLRSILDFDPKNAAAIKDLQELTKDADAIIEQAAFNRAMYRLVSPNALNPADMHRITINEIVGSCATIKLPRSTLKLEGRSTPPPRFDGTRPAPPLTRSDENRKQGDRVDSTPSFKILNTINSPKSPSVVLSTPTNWYQMERELRQLCGATGTLLTPRAVAYLCSIEPSQYSSIIGQNLDSGCLSRLIHATIAGEGLSTKQRVDRLLALSRLPRFDVAWMLVEDEDHHLVKKMLSHSIDDTVCEADLALLNRAYL